MDKFLSHLAEKRAKLEKQRLRIEGEIADLDKAERLYRESGAASAAPGDILAETTVVAPTFPSVVHPTPWNGPLLNHLLPGAGKTIKERVLQLLERNPLGLTSSQILNNLNIDGGSPVSRESLSPQLSRLRTDDQKIDLEHGVWSLKHETPAG